MKNNFHVTLSKHKNLQYFLQRKLAKTQSFLFWSDVDDPPPPNLKILNI